jgi:hypothetical protein
MCHSVFSPEFFIFANSIIVIHRERLRVQKIRTAVRPVSYHLCVPTLILLCLSVTHKPTPSTRRHICNCTYTHNLHTQHVPHL